MTMPSTITLPGTMESLYELMGFVTSFAREKGFSKNRISEIELAMEEVLINIIKYAYKNCVVCGSIEITCNSVDTQGLVIEVVDSGIPFDIFSIPEPDVSADIDERQIGGLGIFFVKQFMDDVRYKREDNQNKLTLITHNANT